jgi:hypothetical protein
LVAAFLFNLYSIYSELKALTSIMVSGGDIVGIYDVALKRRQALMGSSGPQAIIKNGRVFAIAMFACIGGLLYGYNQGVFGGVLAMPNFNKRR